MFKRYQDIYASILLIIFSLTMYVSSFSIKQLTVSTVGSQFLPKVVSVGIFLLSLILLYQGIRKLIDENKIEKLVSKTEVASTTSEEIKIVEKPNYLGVFISVGLVISYIAVMPFLGFILSTVAYLFTQMCVFSHKSQRNYVLFLVISIVVSAFVYYVFKNVLYLMLPSGILG